MKEVINNTTNRYLDKNEALNFKRAMIEVLLDVTRKTDVGYYYGFAKISNMVNNKIDQIFISNDNILQLLKLQGKTLILDKTFSNLNFKDVSVLNKSIYQEELLIKIKELGLNLMGNDNLDPNFKDAIALYFASNHELKLYDFYHRKYYTSLSFLDLRFNIMNTLSIFMDPNLFAQTLCYGELKMSEELDKLSSRRGILKNIIKALNRITMIQNKLLSSNLQYKEVEDIYFRTLAKINAISERKNKDKIELIEEIYDSNYALMDVDVQKKLIHMMRIYDAWNKSNIEDKQFNQSISSPLNVSVLPENKNFIKKLEDILNLIKEDMKKTLQILDKEYVKINDFMIKNVLIKYLKSKKIEDLDETERILRAFEYKIGDEYSYLEEAKATKKLRKKLEK